MNTHKSAKWEHFHVSDLMNLWHVVVSNLEVSILSILMAQITHKLWDCFLKIYFISLVLVNNGSHKVVVIEFKLEQMREINEECHFFFHFQLLSLQFVVINWDLTFISSFNTFCISLVVGVCGIELEANRVKLSIRSYLCKKLRISDEIL